MKMNELKQLIFIYYFLSSEITHLIPTHFFVQWFKKYRPNRLLVNEIQYLF